MFDLSWKQNCLMVLEQTRPLEWTRVYTWSTADRTLSIPRFYFLPPKQIRRQQRYNYERPPGGEQVAVVKWRQSAFSTIRFQTSTDDSSWLNDGNCPSNQTLMTSSNTNGDGFRVLRYVCDPCHRANLNAICSAAQKTKRQKWIVF